MDSEREAYFREAVKQAQRDRARPRLTLTDWLLSRSVDEPAVWPFPLTRDDRLFLAQNRISAR